MRRLVVVSALLVANTLSAQSVGTGNREPRTGTPPRSGSPFPVPSSQSVGAAGVDLTIYLMTMGPGTQIWERFGHNAIRVVDATRGTDSVYNWGTFDFRQPNFLQRFMTGNTLYWMEGDGIGETIDRYRYLNRSVWVQELDLTPAERAAVRDFIAWNARPENLYYRYDYYLDNCSTRVRDIIDRIVGGQLKATIAPRLTTTTYRFHTQRALAPLGAVALGTNIGLGAVADRRISEWEESFLPAFLMEHVREVQVHRPDGSTRPLVKNEQRLFAATRPPEPAAPPTEMMRNLIIGLAIAGSLVVLAQLARSGSRAARLTFTTLATIWTALNGVLGAILIVGWAATRHVFMARNENLLQFDVLSLVLAVTLPMAVARGRAARLTRTLSIAIAAIAVVGFVMQMLPWFNQVNGEVIALTLPAHLALVWSVLALVVAPETAPSRPGAASRAVISRSAA